MSTADSIAIYIEHKRCLGNRFGSEGAILAAFSRSIGNVPLRDIRPAMISRFLNHGGTCDETVRKSTVCWQASFASRSRTVGYERRQCRDVCGGAALHPTRLTSTPKPS